MDPEQNPFSEIEFLVPPDNIDDAGWESEKEVLVQYYDNSMIGHFGYRYYSYPQVAHYVL